MTGARDRIDHLLETTADGSVSSAAVERELRELLDAFDDELYRIKIHNAIQWAKIQSVSAQSERYGSFEQVQGWLIQDLKSAATRAGDIQSNDSQNGHAREVTE